MGYLLEEFEHLIARKGKETDLVLERSHIIDITHSNLTLSEVATDATHIINRENRLLLKLPDHPIPRCHKADYSVRFQGDDESYRGQYYPQQAP